jgi:hypothetical protein
MGLLLHQAKGCGQGPFGQAEAFVALVQKASPSFQRLAKRRVQGLESIEVFHSTLNRKVWQPAPTA